MEEAKERVLRVHRETPWWVRGAVLAVGAALAFLIYVVIDYTAEVKGYAEQNRQNAITTCQQGNESRTADVKNMKGEIKFLKATAEAERADIAGLLRAGVSDPVWIEAHGRKLVETNKRIVEIQDSIDAKIEAIEPYNKSPGSPVKDCNRANPKE